MYGKKNSQEYIDTIQQYVDLIRESRDPLFGKVDVSELDIRDYESILPIYSEFKKTQISKIKKLSIISIVKWFILTPIKDYTQQVR